MSLLVKASKEGQTIARVTPETALWKHVGFAAYRLETGDVVHINEAKREVCIVVLSGTVTIQAGDHTWEKIGSRDSVFEDAAPYAVYLPPKLAATVRGERDWRSQRARDRKVSATADRAVADEALDTR
jgi:5-deoxy-glucuronate isomerase